MWTDYDGFYKFNTAALVGWLIDKVPKGSEGAWPTKYNKVKGQILAMKGHIFEIEIEVTKEKKKIGEPIFG